MNADGQQTPDGGGPKPSTLVLAGSFDHLGRCREFVRSVCRDQGPNGPSPERVEEIVLAANEALVNIIRHALAERPGAPVAISARIAGRTLVMTMEDDGCPFDRAAVASPRFDGSRESGFGVFIIEQLADRVTYDRRPEGGNRLELTFDW